MIVTTYKLDKPIAIHRYSHVFCHYDLTHKIYPYAVGNIVLKTSYKTQNI